MSQEGRDDRDVRKVMLDPIIAWQIERAEDDQLGTWLEVMPVTIEGSADAYSNGPTVIKQPDGRYEIPHQRWFNTDAELLDFWGTPEEAPRIKDRRKTA